MEDIYIAATENSPKVILSYNEGLIEFEGKCYPENTFDFFDPIMSWLTAYFDGNSAFYTKINIKLTYFNSATTQVLFDIFDTVQDGTYSNLEIYWYYDAEDETGLEDFEDYSAEFPDLNIQSLTYGV
jgi:hypothetical protein